VEGDPTTQGSQSADETAVVAAQPDSGVSGDSTPSAAEQGSVVNDLFRVAAGVSPASKPEPTAQTGVSASDQSDGVKPGETTRTRGPDGRFLPATQDAAPSDQGQPPPPGRRGTAIEAQLREQIRQELIEEQATKAAAGADEAQAKADAERYLKLRDLPDHDPLLAEGDNWQWLQEQKALRANYPKAASALRAEADAILAAGTADLSQREQAFLADLAGQMQRVGSRYEVDLDAYKGRPSFEAMAEYLIEHVAAPLQAEITRLKTERDQQLRLSGPRGLGSVREPLGAGRSAPGSPVIDESQRVNDAFRRAAGVV
jgi:hypothetical protein